MGRDYVLGPGDSLTIYVWGLVESVFNETVNRNGEIFVPRAGTLKVWGLTFEKAEQLIRDQLGKVYTGFQISVTLGRLRTIRVFVVGSVARPGSYVLSALSTVTNALFAAGGPSKQGTLRRIQLLRDNRALSEIDFYDFLLRGDKKGDVRLESGDTVFVPQIGPVVALVGRVNQPAIYELKTETRMADLLTLAGGVTPRGFLERVQLERFRANRERVVIDVNFLDFYQRGVQESNPPLKNGDLVRVFPVDLRIYNAVSLEGLVKRPGRYELRLGMRVADLVIRDELLPDAFLDRAEVVRVREDLGTEVIPFSIREAWAGKPEANLELKPLDRVVIRSQMRPVEEVVVTGMVKRPGQYAITRGERLSNLIERAGGLEAGAFPRGAVFTRRSVRIAEQQQLERFIRTQEQSLIAESSAVTAGASQLITESQRRCGIGAGDGPGAAAGALAVPGIRRHAGADRDPIGRGNAQGPNVGHRTGGRGHAPHPDAAEVGARHRRRPEQHGAPLYRRGGASGLLHRPGRRGHPRGRSGPVVRLEAGR